MEKKDTVAVIIITFNRLEMFKKVLNGVRSQTRKPDEIIIVNNSSSDGTLEWLNEQTDITVVTQPNYGSSGGQYTGIKTAFDRGHDWIWTMDDDVVPENDCLERLLESIEPNLVFAPLRYTPTGEPFYFDTLEFNMNNPVKSIWKEVISPKYLNQKSIKADGITFEGPIFHRTLVEKIGLPEKGFFIYADDSEYFIRAKKNGFQSFIITTARLNRMLELSKGPYTFTWKSFYELRNIIAIDVLHCNLLVRLIRPFGYFLSFLRKAGNLSEVKTFIKAFFSGYFYKSKN